MTDKNITNTYKNRQRELSILKKKCRAKIATGDLEEFLKWDSEKESIPKILYNTMLIDTESNIDDVIIKLSNEGTRKWRVE